VIPLQHPLPEGERILWQGAPQTRPLLRQIFRTNLVVAYVGLLLGWCLVDGARAGDLAGAGAAALRFGLLAGGALVLLAGVTRTIARTTTYTITNRRVLLEFGAAFEKTLQIPFRCIDQVGQRTHDDGTADIVLTLGGGQRVNYVAMWPHVRPWRLAVPQPMLRAVPNGLDVAHLLGRAMAADAGMAPVALAATPDLLAQGALAAAA